MSIAGNLAELAIVDVLRVNCQCEKVKMYRVDVDTS